MGLVSIVVDGVAGYELWAGGSLGKAPSLAVLLARSCPAPRCSPPSRRSSTCSSPRALRRAGQGPHEVRGRGAGRRRVPRRVAATPSTDARTEPHPAAADVDVLDDVDRQAILAEAPPGRLERRACGRSARPGLASVTIDLPLGDTCSSELDLCCDLADRHADGHLTSPATRTSRSATSRSTAVADDPARAGRARRVPARRGRAPPRSGPAPARRCARSASPTRPAPVSDLAGNAALRAQLGAAGVRVRLPELVRPAPDRRHRAGRARRSASAAGPPTATRCSSAPTSIATCVGEVVGRVAEADLDAAVDAIVGTWEALRHPGETLGRRRAPPRARRLLRPDRRRPRRPLGARSRARPRPRRLHPLTPNPSRRTPCPSPSPTPSTTTPPSRWPRPRAARDLPRYLCSVGARRRLRRHRRRAARVAVAHRSSPSGSAAAKLVQGAVFGVALTLVVFAGAELFTGNAMVMLQGWWKRTVTPARGRRSCWVGLARRQHRRLDRASPRAVHAGGTLTGPGAELVGHASPPPRTPPPVPSCSGGPCSATRSCAWPSGWRLAPGPTPPSSSCCGGRCSPSSARGFEHSIANVTTFSLGALEGSIGWGALARNLLWTVPGNVVGGGLVIGLGYAWIGPSPPAPSRRRS